MKPRHNQHLNLRLVPPIAPPDVHRDVLAEAAFQRMVTLERKRTERSGKPCLLMLLDAGDGLLTERKRQLLEKIIAALLAFTRETDVTGWYKQGRVAGAIFTEINPESLEFILKTMLARFKQTLGGELSNEQMGQINISFRLFPESEETPDAERQTYYPTSSGSGRHTPVS